MRIPYQPTDFEWTHWTGKDIESAANVFLDFKKATYAEIKNIPAAQRNFENTVYAIERTNQMAEKVLKISFLMNVAPSQEIRGAAQLALEKVEKELIEIEYDEDMYRAVREYAQKQEMQSAEEAKMLKDLLRDYRRMGFDLPLEKRKQLQENLTTLSKLSTEYSKNINEYKDFILVTEDELEGLPAHFAQSLTKEGDQYRVSLDYPEYFPFMENAVSDEKRKELADKNLRKGGEANVAILKQILAFRNENAHLLGYRTHAEFQLEVKMAKNSKTVFEFLNDLSAKVEKGIQNEMQILKEFKTKMKGIEETVQYSDIGFLVNQQRKELFQVDAEKIREYFPTHFVLQKMFEVYGTLFSLSFEKVEGYPMWHSEVEMYALKEKENGNLLAYFFLDLYPREGKYGHAAVFNLISPHTIHYKSDDVATPVAALVCNFPRPTSERPSLLNHNEVLTLFHEFGHVLHEVLSQTRFSSQSGFSVARDFVEAPSQMLENWVWDKDILKLISQHYQTGESLSEEIRENMIRAKNHMVAYTSMRQLIFGIFDMTIHTESVESYDSFYIELCAKYLGIHLPESSLFSAGFGHLMGYDAGYYGYMWSKVFAADMFTRFEAEGVLNPHTGMDYRHWILEKGAILEEMNLVRGFLGREPNSEAFLRELGITE